MARRKRHEEHENHERWLVSYADFITLLFAFFVVMYSISSVNEGKYRVLSNTLTDAFLKPAQSMDPIQQGEEVRSPLPSPGEFAAAKPPETEAPMSEPEPLPEMPSPLKSPLLPEIEQALKEDLQGFIDKDLVNVTQTDRGIEVEMKSKMLFESGSAHLSRTALSALRGVAAIIKPLKNQINVEGHTDNVPINTISFPSNWELSAARAASVVHFFSRLGVSPERIAAIGYGEFQPIADNTSEEGRQKNRRVALVIMASEQERQLLQLPANPVGGGR